jgi:type VI secretion system protein ImpE
MAIRQARPDDAVRCMDAADAVTPEVWGFIDGQEFAGLRDADDRFASVLEAFQDGEYLWFAWDGLRKVELAPAEVLLDQLYRPATITLKDKSNFAVHLPLVYPGSHGVDDPFALGTLTEHVCPDGGPTRCVGGKLLLVGDDAEVPLRECRMIEIR